MPQGTYPFWRAAAVPRVPAIAAGALVVYFVATAQVDGALRSAAPLRALPAPVRTTEPLAPVVAREPSRSQLVPTFLPATALALLAGTALGYAAARYVGRRAQGAADALASAPVFHAVADGASDIIVSTDSRGHIVYFNPAAERAFGCGAEEMVGQPLARVLPGLISQGVPASVRENHGESFQHVAETRVGRISETSGQRRSGEEFPVELSLARSIVGNDVVFTGILRDVTERKLAEQQLRTSEAQFRGLLEAAPDGVVVTGRDGRISLVNAQTERLFGYRRDELVGQRVEILVPERYRTLHLNHRAGYLANPHTRPMGAGYDLYGVRRDGTEFPVAVSLSPSQSGQDFLVFVSVRDITAEHEADEQIMSLNRRLEQDNAELAALNNELEAFSYSVSHDLRAPLRAIDGFSQALLEDSADALDDDGRDHLNRIRRAAQHMGMLIDDLLKLARVTRSEVVAGDVDLGRLAEEIMSELQNEAPERSAEIHVAEGIRAHGDPRLLRIALENLLSNAWKFTAERPSAQIEIGRTNHDGHETYYVRDNGVGFDPAYAGKLFGAFQRLHDSRKFAGTGIGLATVQRIIHKHGGRVWAEAEPDNGATFYFTL